MKARLCILGIVLALLSVHAHAKEHHKKMEANCAQYSGARADLPEADAKFLAMFNDAVRNKDRKAFLSMSRPGLWYVHVFTESANSRGGDLSLNLEPAQIDKELKFHIEDLRPLDDWQYNLPKIDGASIVIGHNICGTDTQCDWKPSPMKAFKMMYDVMECNGNKNAAFVFTNGILFTAMEVIDHGKYGHTLDGAAYFFVKTPDGYQLYTLITLQ